jgi:hypothetical protein
MKLYDLYFVRLFRKSKFLFSVVLVFFLLNISENFIFKSQHTPFFVWDLYANPIPNQAVYSFPEIKYNDGKLLFFRRTWNEPQKLFFVNTINEYITLKQNNNLDPLKNYIDTWNSNHPFFIKLFPGIKLYNDTTELKQFPAWFKKYLEQYLKEPVYNIDIYQTKVAWDDKGNLKKLSSTLLFKLL